VGKILGERTVVDAEMTSEEQEAEKQEAEKQEAEKQEAGLAGTLEVILAGCNRNQCRECRYHSHHSHDWEV
jgi:hypothetical protein